MTEIGPGTVEVLVPPPDPELGRLEPLLGTWASEGVTRDSVLGPGVPVRSVESFAWLDGGYFLVQEYETVFGDEPAQAGVNYWSYDAAAGTFDIIFFSNNGPYTEEGNRYRGRVSGGRLTFEGPARFEYELDEDGAIKAGPDGTISMAWWLRDEKGEWRPWMTNTFARTAVASGRDEEQIRDLVERWIRAIREGDLTGVLADHSNEIVMFDVPPPDDGVVGIDAYRETWPPFFAWLRQGARFELVSLDVTAGSDAAFALALLRCGSEDELREHPERRLRLTVGLRKENGRWIVTHEHHSFPSP